MSSMLSAPATIPATNADTFNAALAVPSPVRVSVSATRSPNPARCANDITGANHRTTRDSGHRIPQRSPTVCEKLASNGCSFARLNLTLDKPHSPSSEGHSSVTTRSRNQLRRWIQAQRQLVTIGMLTALGGCEPQLEVHLNASLNVGLTPTEIVEAITHAAVYCGFPKALNAIFVAKRVFAERDLAPVEISTGG